MLSLFSGPMEGQDLKLKHRAMTEKITIPSGHSWDSNPSWFS